MPKIAREWAQGPAVTAPADELRAWLDRQHRLLRVVFTMPRAQYGHTTQGARIGALEVRISDVALGVGIMDRSRRCPYEICAFLSEAYWENGTLSLRDTTMQPITPEELAAFTHLEVEADSHN